MGQRLPEYNPRNINRYVADAQYDVGVSNAGIVTMQLGTPATADTDGILDGDAITDAALTITASSFETTYDETDEDVMSRYGRCLTMTGGSVGDDAVITVWGRDYLGQPMSEAFTLNGTSGVVGVKAFKVVDEVTVAAGNANASSSIDLGWNDKLGLPYKATALIEELEDGATASAGTFVAPVATQTATSADPRGTYDPDSACNDTKQFDLVAYVDKDGLYGSAHFYTA